MVHRATSDTLLWIRDSPSRRRNLLCHSDPSTAHVLVFCKASISHNDIVSMGTDEEPFVVTDSCGDEATPQSNAAVNDATGDATANPVSALAYNLFSNNNNFDNFENDSNNDVTSSPPSSSPISTSLTAAFGMRLMQFNAECLEVQRELEKCQEDLAKILVNLSSLKRQRGSAGSRVRFLRALAREALGSSELQQPTTPVLSSPHDDTQQESSDLFVDRSV